MTRWLWRRRRIDEDTRAEIEWHLEELTDRYARTGMSREDARAAAMRQFGNITRHREEIHSMNGVRWIDELWQDLRSAFRSVRKRPTLAAGIVATLALGIGSNTAMFSVVNATLLRPLPYLDADRVVYVRTRSIESGRVSDATADELGRWTRLLASIERFEARHWKSVLLTGDEGATRVRMLEVSIGYLSSLGSRIVTGRGLHADDGRPEAAPVALISEKLWRSRYAAREDIVGHIINVDSSSRVIVGVTTDVVSDTPGLRFAVFSPLPAAGEAARRTPALGVAWLRPGVTLDAAQAELQSVSAGVDESGRQMAGTFEVPTNIFWRARQLRDPQLALMIGVCLLLVIACVNVASLLLGAGESRAMELSVRRALGASRGRLARLLLVESLMLAAASAALGLILAWWSVRLFAELDPGVQLQTQLEAIHLDAVVIGYAIAIALFTAVACGVIPALRGSAAQPRSALLEGGGRTATRRRHWARIFVAVEVAVSLVLLIGAGLVGRAFLQMRLADPGFAADRVLGIQIALPADRYQTPERQAAFFDDLQARAVRLPGVRAVGLGYGAMPPSDFWINGAAHAEGAQDLSEASIAVSHVGPGHFELMGIPLLAGRGFEATHLQSSGVPEIPVVVSDSLRRQLWGDAAPVGARFQLIDSRGTRRYQVIGVAGDASGGGLSRANCQRCQWQIYVPLPARRQYTELLLRLADGAQAPTAALRAAIAQIDPGVPSDNGLETAAESLHGFLAQERFRAALFGGFAALAVVLVAFGLLAVVFHAVKERTREFGIRVALGARPSQVRMQVLSHGLRPVAAGIAAGLLLASLVSRTLSSFLLGISPTDVAVFTGSSVFLACVSVTAILVPVLHATRVNPVDVLRSE